jgi:hypothetical protein
MPPAGCYSERVVLRGLVNIVTRSHVRLQREGVNREDKIVDEDFRRQKDVFIWKGNDGIMPPHSDNAGRRRRSPIPGRLIPDLNR